ncbi:hypothetical protein DIZ27_22425 [Streptomyces sp. NWU339]|uniref:hypothetical protein n=1 Tax=Streptomyces sp. NWU339 TaxID=2185284 RepID=UPI000D683A0D|nr:hypothetical protein [Streptomyces sp. NWU339]PWI08434.1 hypothetical protein DIZ27_22425 [Streptomyces sp. NWU339]
MRLPIELRHVAPRPATGAFILDSGLSRRRVDEETAAQLHGMAKNTYPGLERMRPATFVRLLSTGEITLGAALLLPFVPTVVAGAGLAAFSSGLLGLYLRTPGMRQEGSLRLTREGTALAEDAWMLGIGLGFVVDEMTRDTR